MNNVVRTKILAVAAVFLMFGPAAVAQEAPPGNLVETWVVHVDGANGQAFEEAVKAHMSLRKANEDPFTWNTYVNNTGKMGTYYFRHCCFTWADRDAYDSWEVDHAQIGEHWDANVHPHVSSYEHNFSEIDFENSHWPEDMAEPRFVGVTTWLLKPGGRRQFNAVKSELSQLAINNGWAGEEHQWGWSSGINGQPHVSIAVPYADYADMTPPETTFLQFLSEQLGSEEAAAQKFAAMSEATRDSFYEIYMHRPDLSTPE